MELRTLLWLLWLLCRGGGDADSHASFTPTWQRSREHEAAAFRESLNRHRYLNSLSPGENSTAFYGINQFSYLFPEEFKAIYLRSKPSKFPRYSAEVHRSIPNVSWPLRFDWRDKHVVTQVRNQQTNQEDEMAKALLTFGPLVVIVDAVSWQDYLGGIIQHHCSSGEANHAVLITGFDKTGIADSVSSIFV
uniref:Cathepsin O n=1 Tax=Mandrillus leucophaeus TaxID=9568 RepID=A0A2K5ZDN3_MANLE